MKYLQASWLNECAHELVIIVYPHKLIALQYYCSANLNVLATLCLLCEFYEYNQLFYIVHMNDLPLLCGSYHECFPSATARSISSSFYS